MKTNERLYVKLRDGVCAKIYIQILEEGLGALDPILERSPTIFELDDIAEQLSARKWSEGVPFY